MKSDMRKQIKTLHKITYMIRDVFVDKLFKQYKIPVFRII